MFFDIHCHLSNENCIFYLIIIIFSSLIISPITVLEKRECNCDHQQVDFNKTAYHVKPARSFNEDEVRLLS